MDVHTLFRKSRGEACHALMTTYTSVFQRFSYYTAADFCLRLMNIDEIRDRVYSMLPPLGTFGHPCPASNGPSHAVLTSIGAAFESHADRVVQMRLAVTDI